MRLTAPYPGGHYSPLRRGSVELAQDALGARDLLVVVVALARSAAAISVGLFVGGGGGGVGCVRLGVGVGRVGSKRIVLDGELLDP